MKSMLAASLRAFNSVIREVSEPLDTIQAFFLSPLPRRYWRGASGFGVVLSALVQVGACAAALMQSYVAFAKPVSEALANATITTAESSGAAEVRALPAMAYGALTPFGFLAVSSSGRLFAYGVISGLIRALASATGHPCGDPVLTLVDSFIWDMARAARSMVVRGVVRIRSLAGMD